MEHTLWHVSPPPATRTAGTPVGPVGNANIIWTFAVSKGEASALPTFVHVLKPLQRSRKKYE